MNAAALRTGLSSFALSIAVAACSIFGTNLPTHKDWGGSSPSALQAGRLKLSGDCVWLVDDQVNESWMVVWQPGTSRNGATILGSDGSVLAHIGDQVSLGGGEYGPVSIASQLTTPIPAECQTDLYWLVGEVVTDSPPSASP